MSSNYTGLEYPFKRREGGLISLTAFIDPSMQARPKDWEFHHGRELSDLQKTLHWHEIGKKSD